MISTRHKPRGWSDEERALDLALRQAVRGYIRHMLPNHPRSAGAGWLYVTIENRCPGCDEQLMAVSVPRLHLPGLCYCPTCDLVVIDRTLAT